MIDYLTRMTVEEARQRIAGFPAAYADNWQTWQAVYWGNCDVVSDVVAEFGNILRKFECLHREFSVNETKLN